RSPETPSEWERYYDLRWRVLREPWQQPPGSERDELDSKSFHAALWDEKRPVAAGRLHFNSPTEAQIRYMAVESDRQGDGLGSRVLAALEKHARDAGARTVILNARADAAPFYRRHGYTEIGSAGLLFGSIPHFKMIKQLG
ncbi:MAG: GNAT family N-acetyltransferase, partial [Chthoniobacterales bacterium]